MQEARLKKSNQLTNPPVKLYLQIVNSFANLILHRHLSLSTNIIDRINVALALPNLRILSMGRNNLKKIEKLEGVAGTLEELWCSYNQISSLDGLENLSKLTTLYMSNNRLRDFDELRKIAGLSALKDVLFVGNPMYDGGLTPTQQRVEVLKRLPNLVKIDGEMVKPSEREEAEAAA